MEVSYKEVYKMNRKEAKQKLLETYWKTGNISETARQWSTSRQVVRKWVRRYDEKGNDGIIEHSRRPHHYPAKTSKRIEELVIQARKETGYGRKRLAVYLWRTKGVDVSPHTIRHILRRYGFRKNKRQRKVFYPAHWAWETPQKPFSLVQVDVKDILDKSTLGTQKWQHIRSHKLPRYQWTFCDATTRLRFLCYSRELNRTNGIAFAIMIISFLRSLGITQHITWQTDWGQEFGGNNPVILDQIQRKYFEPLNARMVKIPKGRKEYNGRVERSHRTDDEEFYSPLILSIQSEQELLQYATAWVYYYNVQRPHSGYLMNYTSPLDCLHKLHYNSINNFNLFPPIILDDIATELVLKDGNDLLAHYIICGIF